MEEDLSLYSRNTVNHANLDQYYVAKFFLIYQPYMKKSNFTFSIHIGIVRDTAWFFQSFQPVYSILIQS